MQPTFWAYGANTKISANRAKMQIYLRFSEEKLQSPNYTESLSWQS